MNEKRVHPFTAPDPSRRIVIVGAGVFGLSTALSLAKQGHCNITVLDRAPPPVVDGSSVDVSRIMRPDYADPVCAKMVVEALPAWRRSKHYYESGFLSMSEDMHPYREQSKRVLHELGLRIQVIESKEALKNLFPGITGDLKSQRGYLNKDAGWVDAEKAIRELSYTCLTHGVSFISGPAGTVRKLVTKGSRATGVEVTGSKTVEADLVIIATGAWTESLINSETRLLATGQPVAFVKLTPVEQDRFQRNPVYINMSTGFFCFPPTADGFLKVARHGHGYTRSQTVGSRAASLPPSTFTPSQAIPEEAEASLREGLRQFLGPEIAAKPFETTRICWYCNTQKADFLMDFHPNYENVFIATGGSGHAFKFLPVLGDYVIGCLQRSLPTHLLEKFSWAASPGPGFGEGDGDGSRGGPARQELPSRL